jgi:hypothetical protein
MKSLVFLAALALGSPSAHAAYRPSTQMAFSACGALAQWPDLMKEDREIDKWNYDMNMAWNRVRQFDYDCVQVENGHPNDSARLAALMKKRDGLARQVHDIETREADLGPRIRATAARARSAGQKICAGQMVNMADVMHAHMGYLNTDAMGMCKNPERPRRDPHDEDAFD